VYNCTCRYGDEHIMSQDREWIKKEIAKVLIKEGLIDEAFGQGGRHSDLWNTFVAPFTDIVKAAALSTQDILSAVKLNLDLLLALDPDTVKAAHEKYDKRKADLDAKWKPIMDANKAAGGGDAALLTFAVAPAMFLGAQLGKGAAKAPANVYDYLEDSGWSLPLRSLIPNASPPKDNEPDKDKSLIDHGKDIVGKLADLFFIAHHAPEGPLMTEKSNTKGPLTLSIGEADDLQEKEGDEKKEEKKETIKDIDAELKSYFEETGLDQVFKDQAEEMLDMREEMLDDLLSKVKPQLDLLVSLIDAQTPEAFGEALEVAKQNGLSQAVPPNFLQEFEKQAAEIAKDEKFVEDLKKEKPEITEEEVLETAKTTAFANSKEELQVQLEQGGEEIVNQALEAIEYDMPDEQEQKIIEKTPIGKQYYEIYEKAKSELMSYIQ